MKKIKLSIFALLTGLALAGIYSCKGVEENITVDPNIIVKPVVETITPAAPATVAQTAGDVKVPTTVVAVESAVSSGSTTSATSVAVEKAISAGITTDPATLAAKIDAIPADATTIPADVQAQLTSLSAAPATADFLPVLSLPTVEGTTVTPGRTGTVELIAAISATIDECKAIFGTTYNTNKTTLDVAKTANDKTINDAYTSRTSTINANGASCKTSSTTSLATRVSNARADYVRVLGLIRASGLPSLYKAYYTIIYFNFYISCVAAYNRLAAAEAKACDQALAAQLRNAAAARDADLLKSTNAYNTALNTLTVSYNTALTACHNQGGRLAKN